MIFILENCQTWFFYFLLSIYFYKNQSKIVFNKMSECTIGKWRAFLHPNMDPLFYFAKPSKALATLLQFIKQTFIYIEAYFCIPILIT